MNPSTAVAESINHDYLPGEPESRRVWYITLRAPPPQSLRIGMFLRFVTAHHPNTLVPDDNTYQVVDVHGRHVVVQHISAATGLPGDMRMTNYDEHRTDTGRYEHMYRHQPQTYGNGVGHIRMGRTLYTPRPVQHNLESAYIEFPVPPPFLHAI